MYGIYKVTAGRRNYKTTVFVYRRNDGIAVSNQSDKSFNLFLLQSGGMNPFKTGPLGFCRDRSPGIASMHYHHSVEKLLKVSDSVDNTLPSLLPMALSELMEVRSVNSNKNLY